MATMEFQEPFQTVFTFKEAIEYMKERDKYPTIRNVVIRWFSVRTGKEVIIGYT